MKKVGIVATGVIGVGVGVMGYGLHSGNPYLFPPSLKAVCWFSSFFTNIRIKFDEAHGSLKEGKIQLRDARVSRKGSSSKDFDFTINNVDLAYGRSFYDLWRDLKSEASEIPIERVNVKGVKGTIDIKGDSKVIIPEFCIKNLQLENIQCGIYDHTRKTQHNEAFKLPPIAIYRMTGYDLHSRNMLRDALVSSSLLGTLGAGVITLENDGSTISIRLQNVPIGAVSKYVGEPFNWFTQAALDIKATDQFNERNHYMQFDILLRELIPDTAEVSNAYKYVTPLLSNYIKKHDSQVSVKFELRLHEDEITVKKITQQIALQLAAKALEEGGRRIDKGWEELKQFINNSVPQL